MSAQQVLIVTRVALFQLVDGRTTERGNCACAIVASPGAPSRYSMVCYNDQRETLCTAAITSSNENSLQFQMQVNDYASFRDDKANKWSMMFLKSGQLDKFCAVLGAAFYGANGNPSASSVIGDFAPPKSEVKVSLQNRVKVQYSAFAMRPQSTTSLFVVEDLLETNGERPYNFQPTQSAMAREDAKGFESCCLGMSEDSTRVIVVPSSAPRAGRSPYPNVDVVVFVVHVIRILSDSIPTGDAAETVPAIYGADSNSRSGGGGALVLHESTSAASTSLVVARSADGSSPSYGAPPAAASGVPGAVGSGVPAEHMMMIQKAAASINTATTSTRDLHDKVVAFTDDWRQSINRPKPSTLTAQGLEQGVKQLIMDNERVKEEVARRDELIRSLDDRNRDLQKRVDMAAMVAQQLMDEKNKTVSTTSDMKLEKDRVVMKLQEQITSSSNERDDVHRHLQTVKKLLDVSDNELRDVRGRIDVHNVQAQSLAAKLDTSEDALAEERSRRKALEAKVLALQDEIRQAEADLHMKTAALEELNRKADAERTYQSQIMEDERQRRMFDAQQLRSEIVTELQQREGKFQADRARVAEDNFKRGHDEGKQIGKNHARIDVEARLEELMLDAQRARTELDAYKTELRSTTEESMGENRRLESIVLALKKTTDEATRRKAQQEFQLHGLRLKVRNAEDALLVAMTSIAHRLTRPAAPDDLVQILGALKDNENPKLQFQVEAHQAERDSAYVQRYQWMLEDAESEYQDVSLSAWNEYVKLTDCAGEQLRQTIGDLWRARDLQDQQDMIDGESSERNASMTASDEFFHALQSWRQEQLDQQEAVIAEEATARDAIATSGIDDVASFLEGLRTFMLEQATERLEVESLEEQQRLSLDSSMHNELHEAAGEFMRFLEERQREKDLFYADEATIRADIEEKAFEWYPALVQRVEDERAERGAVEEKANVAHSALLTEEAEGWSEIIRGHEAKIFEGLIAAQKDLDEEETAARGSMYDEEGDSYRDIEVSANDTLEEIREREAVLAAQAQARRDLEDEEASASTNVVQAEEVEWKKLQDDFDEELSELQSIVAASTAAMNRNSMQQPSASSSSNNNKEQAAAAAASPLAADPLLGSGSAVIIEEKKKTGPRSSFAAQSDSDDDGPGLKRPPAAIPKKSTASASPTNRVAPAALFGSDSDDEPKPVAKAPPKKAAAKKAIPKRNQLFDSDED